MTMAWTPFEMWYGRDVPPPAIARLKAGKLDVEFQDGDLRYIQYAGRELIRRIYVAIRDVNWNTVPANMTNLAIDTEADRFHVQFDAFHQAGSLEYRWHASIEGKPDGTIEYTMDGLAGRDFRYCRIGFCVLHPIEGIAGSPYHGVTPEGTFSGVLSRLVEPQRIVNGFEVPITPSCSSLTIATPDGTKITTDFEGDLFEMEDQRNWTDGSYKTYCTPLSLGYPHNATANQVFHQKVIVRADMLKKSEGVVKIDDQAVRLTVEAESDDRLPKLGVGMANQGSDPGSREIELLSRLQLDHLKIELHFQDPSWPEQLERAIVQASQIGSALELAIFLTDDSEEALEALKPHLTEVPLARVIVFHESEAPNGTTSARWMKLVHKHLSAAFPRTKFIGGTNGNFAELNRQPPDTSVMDGVSYPINPQVHMPDERSLIEAIEAQRDTVITARSYCDALPICISSVTLKPPFNQAATEAEAPQDPNELPAPVDPRQMTLFAAAWTVGSLRSLASGGADSITYYEMTGWSGLMETKAGSPLPEKFRSFPGMIFPVYWIFEFLADFKSAKLIQLSSDRPLLVTGLALIKDHRFGLLMSNLQPSAQSVRIGSLPVGEATLRRLNQDSMALAASDYDTFLKSSAPIQIHSGVAIHRFEPYEITFMEIHSA
jgi:hypothetical protein